MSDDSTKRALLGMGPACRSCGLMMSPSHDRFLDFFNGRKVVCRREECRAEEDWWDATLRALLIGNDVTTAFALSMARSQHHTITLKPDEAVTINLDDWNIPPDAEIASLSFLPTIPKSQEGPWPTQFLDDQGGVGSLPHQLRLYGATFGRPTPEPAAVGILVRWFHPGIYETAFHHLAEAAKQYALKRYSGVLIPANIAVEAAIGLAVRSWALSYCRTEDDADDFLGPRGVTYGHQLKILTRVASRETGAADLAAHIRILLDKLRQYRNDLVHRGMLSHSKRSPPNMEKAAQFLLSAVFGFHYSLYLLESIDNARAEGRIPPPLSSD